jgi:hypothetical protein
VIKSGEREIGVIGENLKVGTSFIPLAKVRALFV